jgi:transposase
LISADRCRRRRHARRVAAERFGVAAASAVRWVHPWRTTGAARTTPQGGDKRSQRIEAYRDVILAAIEAQVDVTLVELTEMLRREHGASFATITVWRFLDRHAMTVKKTAHASGQERPDVAARRKAWFNAQPDLDPEHLVFIDETGASTKMARLRGRAKRGQRCRAPVPHGHWKTTTFTGALRLGGMTALMVLDGPMNGDAFLAYVEQVLVPALGKGDIAVMDNLTAHRRAGVHGHGSPIALPPAIFARLQSDRERIRQSKGGAAQGRGTYHRRPLERHQRRAPALHSYRMRNCFIATGYEPE